MPPAVPPNASPLAGKLPRRALLGAPLLATPLLAAPPLASRPARAQPAWAPSSPVRVVVPFPPGSSMDIVARLLTANMAADLGQTVVIENRPGAGTLIATDAMARSAPDGQAVLVVSNSFLINPSLHRPAPYDALRQFRPVAMLCVVPHALVVHPDVAADFAGFLARARAPGPGLSFGSPGNGTSQHLGAEQLKLLAGLNATHVPYRGSPQAITDLVAGRLDFLFANVSDVLAPVREGRLRALAIPAPARSAKLAEVPTMAELGYPQLVSDSWYAVVMPAATPDAAAARHGAAWLAGLARPENRARLEELGFDILALDAAATIPRLRHASEVYAEVVRAANVVAN